MNDDIRPVVNNKREQSYLDFCVFEVDSILTKQDYFDAGWNAAVDAMLPFVKRLPSVYTNNAIQEQIAEWSRYNFGNQPSYRPLLGVVEEIGELCHAHLKNEQEIRDGRGDSDITFDKKVDAVGDILIYLLDYCSREQINMFDALENTWNSVKQRDWRKFPKNGRTE